MIAAVKTDSPPDLLIDRVLDRSSLDEFIEFPRRIYADDPGWVPPLHSVLRRKLKARCPFAADTDLRLYIARRDGEAMGTISALRDRRHESHQGEAAVFFGFFECVNDIEVAGALVQRAADTARTWKAATLRGPRNLSRVEEVGVLVEGHDTRPPMLAGHTPAYYAELLEGIGLVKHHDVLAYATMLHDERGQPRKLPDYLADKVDAVDLPGLQVRPLKWHRINRDLTLAHTVFVEAFRDVPDNTPMPRKQFLNIGRAMLAFSNKHMLQLATVDGEAAGFALCFPDINEAIVRADGRLFPAGWLKILASKSRIRTASFKLIGVLPKYRKSGLHALMIDRAVKGSRDAGYERIEASLVDGRNEKMRRVIGGAGMEIYRRYRLYEQVL